MFSFFRLRQTFFFTSFSVSFFLRNVSSVLECYFHYFCHLTIIIYCFCYSFVSISFFIIIHLNDATCVYLTKNNISSSLFNFWLILFSQNSFCILHLRTFSFRFSFLCVFALSFSFSIHRLFHYFLRFFFFYFFFELTVEINIIGL